jgi:hypothetical protein
MARNVGDADLTRNRGIFDVESTPMGFGYPDRIGVRSSGKAPEKAPEPPKRKTRFGGGL